MGGFVVGGMLFVVGACVGCFVVSFIVAVTGVVCPFVSAASTGSGRIWLSERFGRG